MIKQKFDISKKPLTTRSKVAYYVDYTNVEMHRKYVAKYYGLDLCKFDVWIGHEIRHNKNYTAILYYKQKYIDIDLTMKLAKVNDENFAIYYCGKILSEL